MVKGLLMGPGAGVMAGASMGRVGAFSLGVPMDAPKKEEGFGSALIKGTTDSAGEGLTSFWLAKGSIRGCEGWAGRKREPVAALTGADGATPSNCSLFRPLAADGAKGSKAFTAGWIGRLGAATASGGGAPKALKAPASGWTEGERAGNGLFGASGAMGKGDGAGAEGKVWAGSAGCGGRLAKKLFPEAGDEVGAAAGVGAGAGEDAKAGLAGAAGVGVRMPVFMEPGLPKGVKVIGAA